MDTAPRWLGRRPYRTSDRVTRRAQSQPRLRTALEPAQIGLRNRSRALLDRTYYLPPELADPPEPATHSPPS